MTNLRTQIAATLSEDISDHLRAAGFDDEQWAADVCDSAAEKIMRMFTPEYLPLKGQWITRYNSAWRAHHDE